MAAILNNSPKDIQLDGNRVTYELIPSSSSSGETKGSYEIDTNFLNSLIFTLTIELGGTIYFSKQYDNSDPLDTLDFQVVVNDLNNTPALVGLYFASFNLGKITVSHLKAEKVTWYDLNIIEKPSAVTTVAVSQI